MRPIGPIESMPEIVIHALPLPDGRIISWREAGEGRPVVLLHGWSMSSVVFAEVQSELARDFRVLSPDLRGHGRSAPGPGYTLADFVADLDFWMDALGLQDLVLLGWSLGGEVAQLLAVQHPQRISRLLLVASTPCFAAAPEWSHGLPETQIKAMARDLKRNYERTMNGFFNLMFSGEDLPHERLRQIAAFAVRAGRLPDPAVALASLETLRMEDLRPRLPEIELPALVLHGALDRIIPVGAGRYLGSSVPGARYVEWSNIGHAPFLSRPQDCLALWRGFLA